MTREEAIEEIRYYCQDSEEIIKALRQDTVSRDSYEHEYFLRKEFEGKIAILEKAIEALQQEKHEDCVSRAEAMTEIQMNARRYTMAKEFDGMGEVEWSDYLISIKDALDILRNLPPITPTCKKGEEEL